MPSTNVLSRGMIQEDLEKVMIKTSKDNDVLVMLMSKAWDSWTNFRKKMDLQFNKDLTKSFKNGGFLGCYRIPCSPSKKKTQRKCTV